MKKMANCQQCGRQIVAMPQSRSIASGYQFKCDNCGAYLIVVWQSPHYFHNELLTFAADHLKEKETRAAVVEAHGALDVFVGRWTRDALKSLGTPDPVIEQILKTATTRRLIRVVKALFPAAGIAPPSDPVFDFRIEVVHKGKIPKQQAAEDAVKDVRDWIIATLNKTEPLFKLTPDKV